MARSVSFRTLAGASCLWLALAACGRGDADAMPATAAADAAPATLPVAGPEPLPVEPETIEPAEEAAPAASDAYVPYAGEWPVPDKVEKDGEEAELLVQFGDIDNFGFGFPEKFDPFSGESTPVHAFPFGPDADDVPGTDRIMVVNGFDPEARGTRKDGYTFSTHRPENVPVPLRIAFDLQGIEVRTAALQLFVDDFQAPRFKTRFRVRINGRDMPGIAATLNALDQTGPIGKLVTVQLLPEQLPLLADGKLEIDIDDPETNTGDGFAFDFARVLVNPKGWLNAGTIRGKAVARGSGEPIAGVLVSASNTQQATTADDGSFVLEGVPAGLVVVTGSHPDYLPDTESTDLLAKQTVEVLLELEPNAQTSESLGEQLDARGQIDLYGIYFDTDKATLKPESETTLEQVRALLAARPQLQVVIAGHTDAEGGDAHNLALSQRRAAAVVAWLVDKGIAAERLQSEGHGEAMPVAGNDTPEGRALNRRVEIRDARR